MNRTDALRIIKATGIDDILDAVYQGTTDETLTTDLDKTFSCIASCIEREGGIGAEQTARYLETFNPGKKYRVDLFWSHLGITPP